MKIPFQNTIPVQIIMPRLSTLINLGGGHTEYLQHVKLMLLKFIEINDSRELETGIQHCQDKYNTPLYSPIKP